MRKTKEEVAEIIKELSKEDQIELMNEIIQRFWPEFAGKPVGFYDVSKFCEDWDDEGLDEYYQRKWEELQAGRHRVGKNCFCRGPKERC